MLRLSHPDLPRLRVGERSREGVFSYCLSRKSGRGCRFTVLGCPLTDVKSPLSKYTAVCRLHATLPPCPRQVSGKRVASPVAPDALQLRACGGTACRAGVHARRPDPQESIAASGVYTLHKGEVALVKRTTRQRAASTRPITKLSGGERWVVFRNGDEMRPTVIPEVHRSIVPGRSTRRRPAGYG